ncbi:hypothetical protein BJV78DRAFT_1244199, partial [Lactifluus subvellereus]
MAPRDQRTSHRRQDLRHKNQRDKKPTQIVKNTWEHVPRKTMDLPDDWITGREVLVGR